MFCNMRETKINQIISVGETRMTALSSSDSWTQRKPFKCTYKNTSTGDEIELFFPSVYTMAKLQFSNDGRDYKLSNFERVQNVEDYNKWAREADLDNIRSILGIETSLDDSVATILRE